MTRTNYQLVKLTASPGHKLVNGDTIATSVYLSVNSSPEDWREVTEAEAEALQKEIDARLEKERLEAEAEAAKEAAEMDGGGEP